MLRVLLIAREGAGAQALRLAAREGHQVVAAVTAPEAANPVRRVAAELGIELWPEGSVRHADFAEAVRRSEVDLLLNVHSLAVLPEPVLAAPRIGAFNLHPGPLPRCAGLNAPSWAIFLGETAHGVTLHWMSGRIDAGAIAYQAGFAIEERDTGLSLSLKCARAGIPLVEALLRAADADPAAIPRLAQDPSGRRYFGRAAPQGGRLLWTATAREVVDFVRACDFHPFASPWGAPATGTGDGEVSVLRAARTGAPVSAPPGTVGRADGTAVWVAAADEWVSVSRVARLGAALDAAAALRPGSRLEAEEPPAPLLSAARPR